MIKRNRLLSGILGVVLMVGSVVMNVCATDIVEIPGDEIDGVLYQTVDSNEMENWAQGPQIYSESGIVMDIDSGAILYAKNIDDKHYPASITKVATALLALQNYEMDEVVKFTWDDIGFLEYGDAHIGMKENEEITMEDALYGMLLASANEVAHAIGAHMEGGHDEFISQMNEVTKQLGCENSSWVNTNGLHDENHYTSARDMAIIGSAAFEHEKFREIVKTYQHVIPETSLTNEKRYVHQNHKMIREGDNRYYGYCVGGKTGYTDQALTTLITFATKEDVNLVAVVLRTHGGGNHAYEDTRAMLDYGFDNFTKMDVTDIVQENTDISKIEGNSYVMLPSNVSVDDLESELLLPTKEKDKTGTVVFTYEGQEVGRIEVSITKECYNEIHGIKDVKVKDEHKRRKMPVVLKVILIVVGVVLALFLAFVGFVYYRRKQIEKRRRLRRMQRRKQWEENRRF